MKDRQPGARRRRRAGAPSSFRVRRSALRVSPAFTLLELVLVMVVLSILFAMAAPSMSGFGAGRAAEQTASQIVTVARWAREQAITEGRTYRLSFETVGEDTVYYVTAANGPVFERLGVEFGRDFVVTPGVELTLDAPRIGNAVYLEFLPTGRSQPAHVRVVSRNGGTTELACLSATEPLRVVTPEEMLEAGIR